MVPRLIRASFTFVFCFSNCATSSLFGTVVQVCGQVDASRVDFWIFVGRPGTYLCLSSATCVLGLGTLLISKTEKFAAHALAA